MDAIQLIRTREFDSWIRALRYSRAKARIVERTERLAAGNAGKARSVGSGVVELKIDYGPGYRVYYIKRGSRIIVLHSPGYQDRGRAAEGVNMAIELLPFDPAEIPDDRIRERRPR